MVMIEFKSDATERALRNLARGMTDMSDPMAEIADALLKSTQDRIDKGITPEGTPFVPRSQATLDGYASRKLPVIPKGGPLKLTGEMQSQIFMSFGSDYAEVGSNVAQAAMMQFGGAKSEFPNLWGDIPARPFIGLSEDDETTIVEIVEDWLNDLAEPD